MGIHKICTVHWCLVTRSNYWQWFVLRSLLSKWHLELKIEQSGWIIHWQKPSLSPSVPFSFSRYNIDVFVLSREINDLPMPFDFSQLYLSYAFAQTAPMNQFVWAWTDGTELNCGASSVNGYFCRTSPFAHTVELFFHPVSLCFPIFFYSVWPFRLLSHSLYPSICRLLFSSIRKLFFFHRFFLSLRFHCFALSYFSLCYLCYCKRGWIKCENGYFKSNDKRICVCCFYMFVHRSDKIQCKWWLATELIEFRLSTYSSSFFFCLFHLVFFFSISIYTSSSCCCFCSP